MFKALILSSGSEITRIVISILLLLLYVRPSIQQLSLTEGQDAELTFPYPCNSTEVTLQHGYKTPFYHLTSPQDQVQRLRVENRISDGNCFLDLTISSVIRNDEGTYISFVYKDGEILIDKTHRIFLAIQHGDYPPGTASCVEVQDGGRGGDWVSIECTADAWSKKIPLKGKIECFQNGELMPYLTNPVETRFTLTQTILVRSTQPVFCCSSTLNESKGQCACHDTALYLPDDGTEDPCPITTTSIGTVPIIYNSTELTTDIPTKINKGNSKSILVTIIVAFLSVVIILIVYIKWKVKTRSNQK